MSSILGSAKLGALVLGSSGDDDAPESGPFTITGSSPIPSMEFFPPGGSVRQRKVEGSSPVPSAEFFPSGGKVHHINVIGSTPVPSVESFPFGGLIIHGHAIHGNFPITSQEFFPSGGELDGPKTIYGNAPVPSAEFFPSGGKVHHITIRGITPVPSAEFMPSDGALLMKGLRGHDVVPSQEFFPSGGLILRGNHTVDEPLFSLYIRGRSLDFLKADTMDIHGDLNGRHTATFELEVPGGRYRPNPFDPIKYMFGRKVIFRGFIAGYGERFYHATRQSLLKVRAVGPTWWTERRHYGNTFQGPTIKLSVVAGAIFNTSLADLGYTLEITEEMTVTMARLVFEDEELTQCFNRLGGIFNCDWTIDMEFVLRFEKNRFRPAPVNFTDNDGRWREMDVDRSGEEYRNRQGARTAVPASGQRTQTLKGNGTHSYNLAYTLVYKPTITVNDVAQTVIDYADVMTISVWDWAFEPQSNVLRHRGTTTALTETDTILVTATTTNIDVAWTENQPEIDRMMRRYGGSGIVEGVSRATNIRDKGGADAYNAQMLRRLGAFTERVEVESGTHFSSECVGFEVGQQLGIFTTEPLVGNSFIIQNVQIKEIGKRYLQYTLTLVGKEQALITAINVGDDFIDVTIDREVELGIGNNIDLTGLGGLEGNYTVTEKTGNTVRLTGTFQSSSTRKQIIGIEVFGGADPGSWNILIYVDHACALTPLCEEGQQVTVSDVNTGVVGPGADQANRVWRVTQPYSSIALIIDGGNTIDPGTFEYDSLLRNAGTVTNVRTSETFDLIAAIIRGGQAIDGGGTIPITVIVYLRQAQSADFIATDAVTIAGVNGTTETEKLNDTWNVVLAFENDAFYANDGAVPGVRSDLTGFAYEVGGVATLGDVYAGGIGGTSSLTSPPNTFQSTSQVKQVIGVTQLGGPGVGTWVIFVTVDAPVVLSQELSFVNQIVRISDVNTGVVGPGADAVNRDWRVYIPGHTTAIIVEGPGADPDNWGLDPDTFDYDSMAVNGGTVMVSRTAVIYTLLYVLLRGGGSVPVTVIAVLYAAPDANIVSGDTLTIAGVNGNTETERLNDVWRAIQPYQNHTFVGDDTGIGPPRADLTGFEYDGGGTARFGEPVAPTPPTGEPGTEPPSGGYVSTSGGGGSVTGPGSSGTIPENTALVIVAVNVSTLEVTTDRDHGFMSSYPDDTVGDRVAIWDVSGCGGAGVNDGNNINTASTRIEVTGARTFIARDVGSLGGAPGFVDDRRGRCDKTTQTFRGSLGVSSNGLLNSMVAASAGGGTNLVGSTATFLLPAEPFEAATNTWVQTRDYQVVESVSLQLGTPSDGGDYVADLKRNGVSIFAGGGISSPSGSGDLIISTDFVEHPLVIQKGDELVPTVVSVGSDDPGCDAVMNVNLRG